MSSKEVSKNRSGGHLASGAGLKDVLDTMSTDLGKPLSSSKSSTTASLYKEAKRIYVLLDCSGSMAAGQKVAQAKTGVLDFAKSCYAKGYEVGLISFSSRAELLIRAGGDIESMEAVLAGLSPNGSTNMREAIDLASEQLGTIGRRQILVATDGMPDRPEETLEAAERAKQSGIEILTIGTDDADKTFLERVASTPKQARKVEQRNFLEGIRDMTKLLPP